MVHAAKYIGLPLHLLQYQHIEWLTQRVPVTDVLKINHRMAACKFLAIIAECQIIVCTRSCTKWWSEVGIDM